MHNIRMWGVAAQLSEHQVGLCFLLQDLPGALSDAQIAEGLGLHDIKSRDWAIFKTSAVLGEGLFEGLDW